MIHSSFFVQGSYHNLWVQVKENIVFQEAHHLMTVSVHISLCNALIFILAKDIPRPWTSLSLAELWDTSSW